jgi:DHA2 family multidrug resistance protein
VGVLALVLSPLVGKNIHRFDPRRFAVVAFAVFAVVLWLRSRFNTQADLFTILIPTFVQGVAMAFFFIPLMTITLSGLPPERIAAASGLSNFTRITAGAFGTSIATTLWQDRSTLHHAQLVEHLQIGRAALDGTLAGLQSQGWSLAQSLGLVERLTQQQAATRAADDIFLASAVLFVLLIPLVYLTHPTHGPANATKDSAGGH